jgi:hypothetical protein
MRMLQKPQPWAPADATTNIRAIAQGNVQLTYKEHAKQRLGERGLTTGDALRMASYMSLHRTRPGTVATSTLLNATHQTQIKGA